MLNKAIFLFLLKVCSCFLVLPQSNGSFTLPPVNGTFQEYMQSNKGINSAKGSRPVRWDWRDKDKISPVKDQAQCAACWAFSTIANIESYLKIYHNREEVLSEQFLIDCDDAQQGCKDASILATFGHIVSSFGGVIRHADYYPYVGEQGCCRWKRGTPDNFDKHPKPVPVLGFQRVFPDEEVMAQSIFEYGPLSAAINSASMKRYKGGVDAPTDQECSPKELDHAVLIVGYDVLVNETSKLKKPYWIIKNSWGEDWGDKGYYYLVSGRNTCGIASDVSFAYV